MPGTIERNIGNLHDQDTGKLVGYRNPVTGQPEALDAAAIQAQVAGAGIVVPLSTTQTQQAAIANTQAINAALASAAALGGADILLSAQGVALITADAGVTAVGSLLMIYSNTTLRLARSLTLRQSNSDGLRRSMLRNANYASTVQTASGNISAVTGTDGRFVATVNFASAHGYVAGQPVLIKGDTTGVYNGIWPVFDAPTSTSLRFLLSATTGSFAASSGTITVAAADKNIIITGGEWDFNRIAHAGGPVSAQGVNNCALILNKVLNSGYVDVEGRNAAKYMFYASNYHNFTAASIRLDTDSDGVHFKAPGWGVTVRDVSGQSGDDMVAFVTFDTLDTTINPPDIGGEFLGGRITNIRSRQGNNHRVVLLGADNGSIRDFVVDGVHETGPTWNAVAIGTSPGYSGSVDGVTIRNVSGRAGIDASHTAPLVNVQGGTALTIGRLTIEDVKPLSPNSTAPIISFNAAVTVTQSLEINGVHQVAGSTEDCIKFTGSFAPSVVTLNNVHARFDLAAASKALYGARIEHTGGGSFTFTDCSVSGTGSTQQGILAWVFTPGANQTVTIKGSTNTGNTLLLRADTLGANGLVASLMGNVSNGRGMVAMNDSMTLILADNIVIGATQGAAILPGSTGKTYTIHASNNQWISWLFNGGTSATFNLSIFGMRHPTPGSVINIANLGTTSTYNVRACDSTFRLDTTAAGHTFNISSGCVIQDTQAAAPGIYARGPTAYTRIAA